MDWMAHQFRLGKERIIVVPCKTAMQANRAIDEGLAIGAELHRCKLYNVSCCKEYDGMV